nr:hypothetical protein [Rhodoferax sp.]
SGRVETLALDMKAPNGSVYINGGNDVYSVLDPSAEWYELVKQWLPQETFGSGNSARTLEESVAEFAANARFNPDGSKSKEELFQETVRGSDGNKLQHLYIGDSTYGWSRIDIGIENVVFIERQGDNLKDAIGTAGDAFYWSGWRIQDEGASDNLDFTLMYYAMINGRQTKHQAGYSSKPVQSPAPGIYAGKSVNIQSQFININAPVEAGRRTDVALKLDSNTAAEIAEHKNGTELYRLQSVAAKVNGEAATATAGSPSESPKVYWNQADQRIEVAGIDASGGGSITLTGGIINTGNALGKLTVNSGYGKIDIDNSTGEALLVKNLDAGNGGRGFVKVTDTLQAKTDKGEYKTTWFVREADSTDIKVYDNRNGGNSIDTAQLADTVQTASYNPLQGTRYNWSYTYSVQRNLKKDGVTVLGDVPWFGELHPDGEGVFKNASNDGWHVADGFATEKGQKYQRNAATVTTGHDNSDAGGVLTQSVNVTKALYNTLTVGDSSDGIGDNPSGSGEWGNLQGTQIRFYNHIDLDVNLSLKADNPIPVVFKGADKAQITVKSNAAVTVGGNLRNTKGLTQVVATKGDIVTDGTAMVRTQVVDLQADAGRVGGVKAQDTFNLMADSGAPVTIKARSGQGGVHMAVRGDAAIDTIAAAGQAVNVRSTESLRQAEGQTGVAITADVLHIEAASGKGIGEVDKPIVAQVKELNASSHGSIAIKQNQGNLSVGLVQSAFGDVALSAPDGHIVGAAPRADTFEADMQERIKLWESMKIVGDKDNTLARQAVTGYENKVKRLYNDYWFMRKLASDSSVSGFTLNDDGVNLFRLQVNVALGREATRDEVNTAIRERYQSAYGFLTTVQGISASQLATEDTTLATTYQLQAASAPAKRAGPDVATGAPAPDNGMVRATASAQSGSGAEVVTYESLTRGAQWSKEQLGAIINAGAEGGRPSTGAQPNVVASNGKVLLNNDVTKSVAPSVPVEFTLTRTPGSYTPTVKQTSAGEQYSAAQLRAFLANAKPGSAKLTVDPQDPNTIHVSLLQRNDLVVEAKDPVAVKSLADYHLGASQDVVLKDLDVQKTLYVYAGRDVVNGTEKGVASSKVGGLYIDAGRNIGTAAAPIQVAGHNGAAVQLEYVRAPGSMHADFVNTDVVVHDVQIGKGATLTAHQGSFQSAPDTQLDGKFWFEAQAMGSADQAFASVMKPQTEVRVLVDNAAYVTATQGDLRVGDSHASGNLALTSQEGSVLMAGTNEVLSSRKGSIDLFAMNDVGSTSAAMDLDTPKFNAVALSGDVTIKNQQKATADRVYASDGSVHLTVGGDLRPATTDLVIGDVRVAKNLTVKANSVEAKVQQTDNTTPLNVVVTDQQGKQADHVVLAVRDAATVNVEQLNTRTASVQTDADRLRFVQGTVGETMRFSTAHISGYMNNVSPTLEFSQPVQYFIPGKSFSIDVNGKVLANSQAPTYFRPALGVRTTTDVTSGFGVFDINRPTEHRDQRLTRDLTLPMATVAWMGAATPVASLVSAPSRAVNLADDENE